MNNEELIKQYREQLLTLHASTVAIVTVAEIVAYLIFAYMGIELLSVESRYLWMNVALPICINILAHIAVRLICKSDIVSDRIKNHTVIYATIVTSLVVSLLHRDYLVTSCAYVFPMVLSAMYNDKKILKQSFYTSIGLVFVTVAVIFFEGKMDITMLINTIVLYGVIAVSYLTGNISIEFSKRSFELIEKQAKENSELEEEIDIDQMTRLFNHEAFYERLDEAMEISENGTHDLSLVMIDIDDFKNVNDTYGHDEGDEVLIVLADILKGVCSEEDYACRFGGEEFALILCGKSLEEAKDIVKKAMKLFSGHRFDFTEKSLTFSSGIAKLKRNESRDSFFDRADDKLYFSKKNGKNRITL